MTARSEFDFETGKFAVIMYDELRGKDRPVEQFETIEEAQQLVDKMNVSYYTLDARKVSGPVKGRKKDRDKHQGWAERQKASHMAIISKLQGVKYSN